jgi:NAD(P)-dependent dehydrogenase (short-subunit alcohol dehydrogenase family)
MRSHLLLPVDLRDAFVQSGFEEAPAGHPTVAASPTGEPDWASTLEGLTAVYRVAKDAAIAGSPVVFIVSADALLGRTGPLDAMAATGVASASRTLAVELRKQGVPVNCLAAAANTPGTTLAAWAKRLLDGGPTDPTGELIQFGGVQIGKALS